MCNGNTGAAGTPGAVGPPGTSGSGLTNLDDLNGLPCDTGTHAGTVRVQYTEDASGNLSIVCAPTDGKVLSVQWVGSGTGTVSSSPTGEECDSAGTCRHTWLTGTSVTLTVNPGPNTMFTGWSGNGCSGTQLTCTLTMDQDRSVIANFAKSHTVTLVINYVGPAPALGALGMPAMSISNNIGITCNQPSLGDENGCFYPGKSATVPDGTIVTLTEGSESDLSFDYWDGCPAFTSNGNTVCSFGVTSDVTVTATFG